MPTLLPVDKAIKLKNYGSLTKPQRLAVYQSYAQEMFKDPRYQRLASDEQELVQGKLYEKLRVGVAEGAKYAFDEVEEDGVTRLVPHIPKPVKLEGTKEERAQKRRAHAFDAGGLLLGLAAGALDSNPILRIKQFLTDGESPGDFFIDAVRALPEGVKEPLFKIDRVLTMTALRFTNLLGIPEYISGDSRKLMQIVRDTQSRLNEEDAFNAERIFGIAADGARTVTEFAVPLKAAGLAIKGVSWAAVAGRSAIAFGLHEAIRAPGPGEFDMSLKEYSAHKAKNIARSVGTGLLLAGLGKVIPSAKWRIPIVITGFGTATYVQTDGDWDATIDTMVLVAGFEALGVIKGRGVAKIQKRLTQLAKDRIQAGADPKQVIKEVSEITHALVGREMTNSKKAKKAFHKGVGQLKILAEEKASSVRKTVLEELKFVRGQAEKAKEKAIPREQEFQQKAEVLRKRGKEVKKVEKPTEKSAERVKKLADKLGTTEEKAKAILEKTAGKKEGDLELDKTKVTTSDKVLVEQLMNKELALREGEDISLTELQSLGNKVIREAESILGKSISKEVGVEAPSKALVAQKIKITPTDQMVPRSVRGKLLDGVRINRGKSKATGEQVVSSINFPKSWGPSRRQTWMDAHKKFLAAAGVGEKPVGVGKKPPSKPPKPPVAPEGREPPEGPRRKRFRPISWLKATLFKAVPGGVGARKRLMHKGHDELVAAVIRAAHLPEAEAVIEWQMETVTSSSKVRRHWKNLFRASRQTFQDVVDDEVRLPKKVQRLIGDAIGGAKSDVGIARQKTAREQLARLPKRTQRRVKEILASLQDIRDYNLKVLRETPEGKDTPKVKDYFYGLYKNAHMFRGEGPVLLTSTERYLKHKGILTIADARGLGLELTSDLASVNLKAEYVAIQHHKAMGELRAYMNTYGKGSMIREASKVLPTEMKDWVRIEAAGGAYQEPWFEGMVVRKDIGTIIKNHLDAGIFSRSKTLQVLRGMSHTARLLKFLYGTAFHVRTIFQVAVADVGLFGFAMPWKWPKIANRLLLKGISDRDRKDPLMKKFLTYHGDPFASAEKAAVAIGDKILGSMSRVPILGIPAKLHQLQWKLAMKDMIPRVKWLAFRDVARAKSKKLKRKLSPAEYVEIINEGQNFYGEMSESNLGFGRTMTALTRLDATAPGFFAGNFLTMLKAVTQWKATRSRVNIVNSVTLMAMTGMVIRRILEGVWPKPPETIQELFDLSKIPTGVEDDKGNMQYIELATYESDYRPLVSLLLTGNVGKFADDLMKRASHTAAPFSKVFSDALKLRQGEIIYDRRSNRVYEITDTRLQKVAKLFQHEVRNFMSYGYNTQKHAARIEGLSALDGFVMAASGTRLVTSEAVQEQRELTSLIWSMRDQQENLYRSLGRVDAPKAAVQAHNMMVERIFRDKDLARELGTIPFKKKDLLVDVERLLTNKVAQLTSPSTTSAEAIRIRAYLKNWGITSTAQYGRLLRRYFRRNPRMRLETMLRRRSALQRSRMAG